MLLIRTVGISSNPRWYVAELRGVVYITWVSGKDKRHALQFPEQKIKKWIELIEGMTGFVLESISYSSAMIEPE